MCKWYRVYHAEIPTYDLPNFNRAVLVELHNGERRIAQVEINPLTRNPAWRVPNGEWLGPSDVVKRWTEIPNNEEEQMKCNHPIEAPVCSFHYNGLCLREHNYECPALSKPRYVNANKLIDLAMHEGAYGYVDIYDICHAAAVDVVEVVRCKDCKNARRVRNGVYRCPYDNKNHIGGFYCAYGERRNEDG